MAVMQPEFTPADVWLLGRTAVLKRNSRMCQDYGPGRRVSGLYDGAD
jgi:hypothetical protein